MTHTGDYFPTYLQWLASHSDDQLRTFFTRLSTEIYPDVSHHSQAIPTQSERALNALLTHLDALQLAVLHAAAELDAGRYPASYADIVETLDELFDIAGTLTGQRPETVDIHRAVAALIHRGLLFAPELQLHTPTEQIIAFLEATPAAQVAVPSQVPAHFNPGTSQLWRLVDVHRNPRTEEQLRADLDALTPRQSSVMRTLHANGGVGHSAAFMPGANPEHPLALMLASGVLDRIDDNTARITGRAQQILNGVPVSPPGGMWQSIETAPPHTTEPHTTEPHTTDQRTTDSVVAQVIQFLTELLDSVVDLSHAPLTPLNSGGLGIREMKKVAKRRGIPESAVLEQISWLLTLNLVTNGETSPRYEGSMAHFFAVTEAALDMVESDPASQWAQVLLSWAQSGYSPWLVGEDCRPGQSEAYSSMSARARQLLIQLSAQLVTQSSSARIDMLPQLWRVNPFLAWTTPAEVWDALLDEAHQLGLVVLDGDDVVLTPALLALAEALKSKDPLSSLTTALQTLLPAAIDMLIIQGDHTILAPGPLAPEDAHMLASFADKESSGIASVWRVSSESARRAMASGRTAESIIDFLGAMSPARSTDSLPQSLRYLFTDTERMLAHADADSSTLSTTPPTFRVETPPGITELSDADADVLDTVHIPSMLDYVGAYRDWLEDQDGEVEGLGGTEAATNPTDIKEVLRVAEGSHKRVDIEYADSEGHPVAAVCNVVTTSPSRYSLVRTSDNEVLHVQPHRMISARLVVD